MFSKISFLFLNILLLGVPYDHYLKRIVVYDEKNPFTTAQKSYRSEFIKKKKNKCSAKII